MGPGPYGDVAGTAAEAWPDAPNVPPLTRSAILQGCAAWAACKAQPYAESDRQERLKNCAQLLVAFNAERAIPMTGLMERPEFFLPCVLNSSGDCSAIGACLTQRPDTIICEEDGCRAAYKYRVSCKGDVATLDTGGAPIVRDCSRAFAKCDENSYTGCSDRPFSQCDPSKGRADRCDGDIRLGCDGSDQVSYRDCSALGGTCGPKPDGSQGCIYPSADQPPCVALNPSCNGGNLTACMNGETTSVSAPSFCPP